MNASDNSTETPVASFSADVTEGKVPLEVWFTDTSSGEPTSWEWDFGDGNNSTLQNVSHVFDEAGTFDVSLTVSNANGTDSLTEMGYISADTRPVVAIDSIVPDPAIRGEQVNMTGIHVYNYSAIPERYAHRWYSDLDGLLCKGKNVYTGSLSVGNHTISYQVVDSEKQWSDPVYGSVVVLENIPPIATIDSITPNPAFKNQEIKFSGTGIDPDGRDIKYNDYEWHSNIDNFLSNESSFSTSSLSVGTHTINFSVRDHLQQSPVETKIIEVKGNTLHLQAEFHKTISTNNPVDISVNVSGTDPESTVVSIIDSSDNVVLTENITEKLKSGKYTFEWDATDQQGDPLPSGMYNLSLMSDSISEEIRVTVDNTAPTVVIDDISGTFNEGDIVYANSELLVKVSESERDVATVDITLSSISGDFTETISANNEDGTWIGEFDLSSVPDGNYTVTAVAKDTAKNIAKNINDTTSHITVNVDKTAPVIGDYSPADGKTFDVGTTAVDISFYYSDARTGINTSSIGMIVDNIDVTNNATINASSASYNATSLAKGAHTASISLTDNTGNEKTFTTNFWIGPKPSEKTSRSSGSSGGGGGGVTTGEKYENVLITEVQSIYINKDSHVMYEFNKEGNAITGIQFNSLKNSGNIKTVLEILKGRSSFAQTDAPGNVYQQMNIWVGKAGFVSPENIEDLRIVFRVERSWLEENNIGTDTVKLYRYSDDSWDALSTSVTSEDGRFVYFESQTPGFSPFAISSDTEAVEVTEEASLRSVNDEDAVPGEGSKDVETTTRNYPLNVLVVIGVISLMLAGVYALYRKQR
ncbi:PGF-pre-PGF domain-containing protein [Methanolobus halotolerans]|uniref:PGF-pre-PGF domain-containing protein n=1 Tax=Methanolobus halotolerans TaxID=2052935 RepID=UPI00143687F6|nr:PGF-pre-PGF domain-containing protein [Methanolobus halotolerans]